MSGCSGCILQKAFCISLVESFIVSHQIYDSTSYYIVLSLLSHKTETNLYSCVVVWILLCLAQKLLSCRFSFVVYMTMCQL